MTYWLTGKLFSTGCKKHISSGTDKVQTIVPKMVRKRSGIGHKVGFLLVCLNNRLGSGVNYWVLSDPPSSMPSPPAPSTPKTRMVLYVWVSWFRGKLLSIEYWVTPPSSLPSPPAPSTPNTRMVLYVWVSWFNYWVLSIEWLLLAISTSTGYYVWV